MSAGSAATLPPAVPSPPTLERAARWQFSASVGRAVLAFTFQWLLARAYGLAAFGICNTAHAGLHMATILGKAGGDAVLFRTVAAQGAASDPARAFGPALTLSLVGGLVSGLGLLAWGVVAWRGTGQLGTLLAFALAGLTVPSATVLIAAGAAFQVLRRFRAYALTTTVLDPVVRLAALGLVVLAGAHWLAAMSSIVVGAAVAVLAAVAMLRPQLRGVRVGLGEAAHARAMLTYGGLTTVAMALQPAMELTAFTIMGVAGTPGEVGMLAAAVRVAFIALWIQVAMAAAFLPQVPTLTSDVRHRDDLRAAYGRVVTAVLWINGPMLVAMIVGSTAVLRLFGEGFERGAAALVVLAVAQWVNSATALAEDFLPLSNRSGLAVANNAGAVVLTGIGGYALGFELGVVGVALALAGTTVLLNLVRAVQVWRLFGVTPPLGTVARSLVACAVPVAVLLPLVRGTGPDLVRQVGLAGAGGVVALAIMLGLATRTERGVLRGLLSGSS